MAAAKASAAIFVFLLSGLTASGQSLSVLPIHVFLGPGEKATSLTVSNQGSSATAVQIRAYAWAQKGDEDQLTATNTIMVSPPMAKIAPGGSQIVRVILRQLPDNLESTYRIVLDQIPPAAEPGVIHVVVRMSLPVFSKPAIRSFADVQFHLERKDGKIYLVGFNAGNLHEVIRDIALKTSDGQKLKAESGASPYILAGATRRWHIAAQDAVQLSSEAMQLTAQSEAGAIEEQVRFVPGP
jgi:fimbrial chaperone protein